MGRSAREVIQEAKDYRDRWGTYGFGSRIDVNELMSAAVELLDTTGPDAQAAAAEHEELVLTKRQLTASKAREGKLKKQIEKLQSDLRDAQLTSKG